MAFEQKPNTGALFRDDRKSSETDRDYSGTLNVDGVDYWISGWIKESKKGTKFLSLSVKPKEPKAEDFSSGASPKRDMDDEIPF